MKKIYLGKSGFVTFVDDEDYRFLMRWRWYTVHGRNTHYVERERYGGYRKHESISMHRVIMDTPDGIEVDHKDGDGLNNQKSNLRNCYPHQNKKNRQRNVNNTSGHKGVYVVHAKRETKKGIKEYIYIFARITVDSKRIHLGVFKTIEDAGMAYDEAALKYFGEFVRENP